MKKVKLILRDPDLNKMIDSELELLLDEQASIVDVIRKVDEIICGKGEFPIKDCRSLLQLTFHPTEQRFYKHVALTAYSKAQRFLNVREDPNLKLPDNTVIVLSLTLCQGEWEEVLSQT